MRQTTRVLRSHSVLWWCVFEPFSCPHSLELATLEKQQSRLTGNGTIVFYIPLNRRHGGTSMVSALWCGAYSAAPPVAQQQQANTIAFITQRTFTLNSCHQRRHRYHRHHCHHHHHQWQRDAVDVIVVVAQYGVILAPPKRGSQLTRFFCVCPIRIPPFKASFFPENDRREDRGDRRLVERVIESISRMPPAHARAQQQIRACARARAWARPSACDHLVLVCCDSFSLFLGGEHKACCL